MLCSNERKRYATIVINSETPMSKKSKFLTTKRSQRKRKTALLKILPKRINLSQRKPMADILYHGC
jgi:hypothetical protein